MWTKQNRWLLTSGEHNVITDSTEHQRLPKFLCVHIVENLTWTSAPAPEGPTPAPSYRRTIQSILCSCITAWYGNYSVPDHKSVQRIVRTAESGFSQLRRASPFSVTDIHTTCCIRKATRIVDDPTHTLISLLPPGRRFHSILSFPAGTGNGFFPKAIRLLRTHSVSSNNSRSIPFYISLISCNPVPLYPQIQSVNLKTRPAFKTTFVKSKTRLVESKEIWGPNETKKGKRTLFEIYWLVYN